MNSFIKNNKRFFSLLVGILLHSSLTAITFQNESITNFIQPGDMAHASFPENSFIILDMESDNFDVKHGNIENLAHLKETFQKVKDSRSGCSMSSRSFTTSSNNINFNGSYLNGWESINMQGKISLQLIHCLLESPLISIAGNKMKFVDCFFINPDVLNIIIDSPESDYDSIQILFYGQPENPTIITGEIDLNNNQTTGEFIIISNVKEINVKFKWDKNSPQKSNTEETSTVTKNSQPQKSDSEKAPATTRDLQPSYTSYQWPDKHLLKEIVSLLFSPQLLLVTLSASFLLYREYSSANQNILTTK